MANNGKNANMINFWRRIDWIATSPWTHRALVAVRGLWNLLMPNPCALCVWSDAQTYHLCQSCKELLKEQVQQIFQAQDFADALPLDLITGQALPVFSASYYTPEMAKVVLKFKDHQRIRLAGFLRPIVFRALHHATETLASASYRLVPIPASGSSMRRRGYNPALVMLPRQLPGPMRLDTGLLKSRWQLLTPAAHHGTGVQKRREQSRKKFRVARWHTEPAEPVVLFDDVLTSGATLAAATRTLQAHGYDVVAAVVFSAVTPTG